MNECVTDVLSKKMIKLGDGIYKIFQTQKPGILLGLGIGGFLAGPIPATGWISLIGVFLICVSGFIYIKK